MGKAIDKMVDLMCAANDWLDEKHEKYASKLLWFVAFQVVVMIIQMIINEL
jgi:hypothetical protein